MTTSEWGSTGSPRADFTYGHRQSTRGYGQAPYAKGPGPQYTHSVNAPRSARAGAQAAAQSYAHPGFGAPQAYGTLPGQGDAAHVDPWDDPFAAHRSPSAGSGVPLSRMLNLLGGLVSILLIVGLAIWGYQLAVRDVSGVPVVKALEGPMRIAPDDPGGDVARHQGLAVNGVAGEGTSAGPVDQVTLAPAAVDLAEDDVPAHPMTAFVAGTAENAAPAVVDPVAEAEAHRNAVDAAVAEALGLIGPLSGEAEDGGVAEVAAEGPAADNPRARRPMPRPAGVVPVAAVATVATDGPAPARPGALPAAEPVAAVVPVAAEAPVALGKEVSGDAVGVGVRMVQLGAFESAEMARKGMTTIAQRFPAQFTARDWTIEEAQSGGAPFYRLRALGFDSHPQAQEFCAELMAANTTCIPVVTQ